MFANMVPMCFGTLPHTEICFEAFLKPRMLGFVTNFTDIGVIQRYL